MTKKHCLRNCEHGYYWGDTYVGCKLQVDQFKPVIDIRGLQVDCPLYDCSGTGHIVKISTAGDFRCVRCGEIDGNS